MGWSYNHTRPAKKGAAAQGRKELAAKSEASEHLILEWVNRLDLFRIRWVAEKHSDLLEAAGVDTVFELAQRNAANLYTSMVELNTAKRIFRILPAEGQVANGISQAKKLPRAVEY
ncbi:MAG: DUF4332 domain-containing protein [Anaerolineales bacterium]|nr:DUF4332 domain-containing protein [Anaerolineales bacterium]